MKMEQFQVNTKFLNSLPPKWSNFVTDVKLVKDVHTTNFDQLHMYFEQHEQHANEVRLLRERNQDPLAFEMIQLLVSTRKWFSNSCSFLKPKRPRNATWYKDKAMLAEAQEVGQILDDEKLAFLADPGVPDGYADQIIISNNAAF
uniref:Integrase, catalytic region, zinc finger, CCHC-type, peptidase aspartic, catalytic n=1 Tax=Tanacetum cinerariifolium TaxID=118510 RepID=A0A699KZU4_TANCI|nr:hypothetical protein [Tanacetum cinerariifolium]